MEMKGFFGRGGGGGVTYPSIILNGKIPTIKLFG